MIDRNLILKHAPSAIGEQIHIDHVGCSAGFDHKRRLYIKRAAGGVVAYCHHCNEHGFVLDKTVDGVRLRSWLKGKEEDVPSITKEEVLPKLEDLDVYGVAWLSAHHCNLTTGRVFFGGVGGRTAFILRDPEGSTTGLQLRKLDPATHGPKYITQYLKRKTNGDASWFHKHGNTSLVITEDYLSAYRIYQDIPTLSSCALLKTSISDATLQQISDLDFKYISIWLDPDAAGKKGAKEAIKKLSHFLPLTTRIIGMWMDKEPKHCTHAELASLLI